MADGVRTRGPQRTPETEGEIADEIYAATLELMAEQPFGELSVAQILRRAAVSRATFYAYFPSKFAVLRGLLERAMIDISATVSPFLQRDSHEPPEAALERSIRAVTHTWGRHRLVLQAVTLHWPTEPEIRDMWLTLADRLIDSGAREIERERAAGLLTTGVGSRKLAATLFWGTERVLYIAGLGFDDDLEDEDSLVDSLVAMWSGTLYGTR
ncbi:TetR/AcrR family transcriptional regulator [Gordonia sp. NPDC003376]